MSALLNKEINDSKMAMWRSAVAILHADGNIDELEKEWLHSKIEKLGFSDEQVKILENDLRNKVSFDIIIEQVTDRKDRAFLLHLVRTLGHLDGEYCSREQKIYEELHEKILGKLNIAELEQDITESDYDHHKEISSDKKHSLLWRGLDFFNNLF